MPDRVARRVWRKEKSLMTERGEEGLAQEVAFCGSLDKGFRTRRLAQGDVELAWLGWDWLGCICGPNRSRKGSEGTVQRKGSNVY